MSPTFWYVVIAVLATMFVANTASRGEFIFWDFVVGATVTLLCLVQAGAL